MKTSVVVGGIVATALLVVVVSYVSNYNYGNRAEKVIQAEYTNMENILGQYSLKVKETAQVPDMMADDLSRVVSEAMTGRYGENGSQATFQWIKENYPGQVSPQLYTQIQQVMEAGRNKFENAQTVFIDTKRAYETNLGYLWKGAWLSLAGYPKINLDEYKIITSGHAQKAFDSGVDEAIQLR